MGIEKEELEKFQEQMEVEIRAKAEELCLSSESQLPITDGVCDFTAYLESNPKIMWVLKEPYDEDGGGFSIPKECFIKCRPDEKGYVGSIYSWRSIIYSMYGFYEGKKWAEMDWIYNNTEMPKILQKIAYINISKMPGKKTSSNYNIAQAYEVWKSILHVQIEGYNPDVIIFGNTYQYFSDYFGKAVFIKEYKKDGRNYINKYRADGRCLLWGYHPGARVKQEMYVDTIIEALNEFLKEKEKI